jgi:hypothetical protein
MNQTLKVRRVSSGPFAVNTVVRNRRTKPCVVPHAEYLDSLPSPCTIYSFQINPGLAETFTWLSMQARLWEEYRIVSMVFEWEPAVSANAAITCHAAIDYDSRDDDPSSVYVMSNFSTYHSWPARLPHRIAMDPVLANRAMPYHYVRNGTVSSTDIKTYDVAKLILCLEGDALAHAGRIQVHYVVEFCSPTIEAMVSPEIDFSGRHTSTEPYAQHVPWRVADVVEKMLPFFGAPSAGLSGGAKHCGTTFCSDGTTNIWPVQKDLEGLMSLVLPRDYGVRSDTGASKWWPALAIKDQTESVMRTNFVDEPADWPQSYVQNMFDRVNEPYSFRAFDTDDHETHENMLYRVMAYAGSKLGIVSQHGASPYNWTTVNEVVTSLFPKIMFWAQGSHPMVDFMIARHDQAQAALRKKRRSVPSTVKGKEHVDVPEVNSKEHADETSVQTVVPQKSCCKRVEFEEDPPECRKR